MQADYLVVGAGAMAMAFVDVMLRETDATFIMVDKRHAPGGHWNDAYPHVRLHQPSSYYGVASRPLGRNRKDERGFNRGFYELASGIEVAAYFHAIMQEDFLPSGRVAYLPLTEYVGDGEIVSLMSGERTRVEIGRKLVNVTTINTQIPLTHVRKFEVADGVACIPPNDLPRLAPRFGHYAILGAGKTAIDAACWLLGTGVAPEKITWVLPRDPWLINRATGQPGLEFFATSLGGVAHQYEAFASVSSFDEIGERMEAAGNWFRIDPVVKPTMFHGATVTALDLEHMRRIPNIVRLGRVRRIEPGRMNLDDGEAACPPDTLFVDCTARALDSDAAKTRPTFEEGRINVQMLRAFQPCFSAALIAHMEATIPDDAVKQSLSRPTPMNDTVEDWARIQIANLTNQFMWAQNEELSVWMANCRLNAFATTLASVPPDDQEKRAILGRIRAAAPGAVQNLSRLSAQGRS